MTEDVLIDFKVDYTELINAQEQLAKGGKIDATGFQNIQKAITTTATDTKGLITEFKKVATTATQMGKSVENAFGAGIQDALDEAGVSVKDFSAALTKANAPAKSLKQELLQLKEALAQAKANGKDVGVEFEAMRKRAGQLRDAIDDANKEIKNAGSDTRNIDNVVGSISALAGGFAAVQGAAALFGNESEDVQKALLKVNGAMALATGLQQFYNATLKEGALTKLADSIATGAQSAAMTLYTFVTGGATVATKALRLALISTGIGAIVVLVAALVSAWADHNEKTKDAKTKIEELDKAYEALNRSIDRSFSEREEIAKLAGAAESETLKIQLEGTERRIKANRELENSIRDAAVASAKSGKISVESAEAVNKAVQEGFDLNSKVRILEAQIAAAEKSENEDRIKALDELNKKNSEANKKAAAAARAARLSALNDILANLERELLLTKKGGEVELSIKKDIVRAKRDIELAGEKLTAAQIKLIKERANQETLNLQKDFNKKATEQQLQSQIDTNNALLAGITLNNEQRLQLQIETLETTSQLEINAAEGNAAKILLIEAKKQADIRALKNKAIDDAVAADIASNARTNRIVNEALNKTANNQKESVAARIAAIEGIGRSELIQVDKLIDANKKKTQSNVEYNANYKKLADQRADIEKDTSDKIDEINKQDKEQRIENLKDIAAVTLQVASQVADFFAQLSSLATEQERQRIDAQKEQLRALVEAGAITAKEAKIRGQQIEIAERKAKQLQAKREKDAAIFKALIAIPQAFLTGLSQGGPVLGAIYAALAAASAAVIISRPVPKFFKGKKGSYEGAGIVADQGAELVERGGRMFLYTNPTRTYLGAKDKVYTASETRNIMHNTNLNTTIRQPVQERFDYDKLAKAIPKHSVAINIEKDFIEESVANGLMRNKYFNNRYRF